MSFVRSDISLGKTRRRTASVALAAALLASVFGAPIAGFAQDAGKPVVIARDMDLNSLDPSRATCDTCQIYLSSVYDRLVDLSPDNKLVPMIAKEWSTSDDQKVVTFKLDPAAKFSDGSPVEAKDVKWTLERLKNLKGGMAYLLDNVKSIDAPDAATVVITLSVADSEFVGSLTAPYTGIINSDVVMAHGGDADADASTKDNAEQWLLANSAGAGPYTLSSYSPNSELRLKRNENYWRKKPSVGEFVFLQSKDAVSQTQLLQNGSADIAMQVDPTTAKDITDPNIVVETKPSFNMVYLAVSPGAKNLPHPLDAKIREAIASAIDYDGIIDLTVDGKGKRLSSPLPIGFPGGGVGEPIKHDVEKAKKLMAEAGVADGFTLNATYPNVNQYGVDYSLMMQKVQQDLAEINIKLDLQPVEFSVWREKINADGIPVTAVFFAPDYYGSSQYAQYFAMMDGSVWYKRSGGKNDPTLANPETPKLLAEALSAKGDESSKLFGKLGEMMANDRVILPIVSPDAVFVSRKGVSGLRFSACCNIVLSDITAK
ncbi:ABC transporter substrate-binding protein [Neorhizobium sp. P12A]|uniref:ABC transporter substrate-binding protein n=1 Tax=Rhizobium/Agrobacterium group TaxID=227290 RepID=UPI00104F6D7E|nr:MULTISPECIES: ABC transporter substrate-binding protein [Rhizobium/Agrobacterium group]KAA0697964.1 ABC transporter substrate-binding protein [Neorhizobium sp. P12A]TCR87799.1 peptide/nickel transport system substrate-binding protein [Rhizobium sp. BK376]